MNRAEGWRGKTSRGEWTQTVVTCRRLDRIIENAGSSLSVLLGQTMDKADLKVKTKAELSAVVVDLFSNRLDSRTFQDCGVDRNGRWMKLQWSF